MTTNAAERCSIHKTDKVFKGGRKGLTGDPYLECPKADGRCSKVRITEANAHLFPENVAKEWLAENAS